MMATFRDSDRTNAPIPCRSQTEARRDASTTTRSAATEISHGRETKMPGKPLGEVHVLEFLCIMRTRGNRI